MKLSSLSEGFFLSICKLFKLSLAQELIFVFALQNSTHLDLQRLAREHCQKRLVDLLQITPNEAGLTGLPVETLHSLLIQIQQSLITSDQLEQLFNVLRKGSNDEEKRLFIVVRLLEYPLDHPHALILAPILFSSIDLTNHQRLSDANHLSTSVVRSRSREKERRVSIGSFSGR